MLPPVTCRVPGALVPSPQLHLGRRWGGSLHVCKTRALCHTPLTSLSKGGGGEEEQPWCLSWLLVERPVTQQARGGRGTSSSRHVSAPTEGACGKRNMAQHGPRARTTQLPMSRGKSHHSSPLCSSPLARWFFTAKMAPPRGCHPA